MEEKLMLGIRLSETDSSDLFVRGGASPVLSEIFLKAKAMINFIADYIPKFLKGFKDGFSLTIF